jgi:glutaredoxin-like protein
MAEPEPPGAPILRGPGGGTKMERTFLGPREAEFVRQRLGTLPRRVTLLSFRERGCPSCDAASQLASEISGVVPQVGAVDIHRGDPRFVDLVAAYGIGRVPAVALTPDPALRPDNGIRFFGFPGGYEFDSLLDAISRVARGEHGLSSEMVEYLMGLGPTALHLEVFVTPTCPYCPRMVQLAHHLALLNPAVRADMIDASEFPEWAERYDVRGVPLTVAFDGAVRIEGLVPESRLLREMENHLMPVRSQHGGTSGIAG